MIGIVIVTHGEFGAYLLEAAEGIVGPQTEGVRCVGISARTSLDELRERIARAIAEARGEEGAVVLIDMPGGTPCNVAMPLIKDDPRVSVIGGANLYMLVAAFNHRKTDSVEGLTERMIEAGRKAVTDVKAMFLAKA